MSARKNSTDVRRVITLREHRKLLSFCLLEDWQGKDKALGVNKFKIKSTIKCKLGWESPGIANYHITIL